MTFFLVGVIAFKDDSKEKSFTLVYHFYNLDENLLEEYFRIFKTMKKVENVNFTKASEVYDFLCQDGFFP